MKESGKSGKSSATQLSSAAATAAKSCSAENDSPMDDDTVKITVGCVRIEDYIRDIISEASPEDQRYWVGWFDSIQGTRPRHAVLCLFSHICTFQLTKKHICFVDGRVVNAVVDI